MSDKELLEFAAKAAGIAVVRSRLDDPLNRDMLVENSTRNPHQRSGAWNPLIDDGDALRLAVRVGVDIVFAHKGMTRVFAGGYEFTEYVGDEPCAATRRAVVRAAAEIGKAMP